MTDRKNNHTEKEENNEENGFEINLPFGDFFKGLGNFLNMLGNMEQEGKKEHTRTGQFRGPGGSKAVYGYSVRLGLGGKPALERFGNFKEDGSIDDTREPLTDVFDEEEVIIIVLEMPGIDESTIDTQINKRQLIVKGTGKKQRYKKILALPASVEPESLEKAYRNGILEIKIKKKKRDIAE